MNDTNKQLEKIKDQFNMPAFKNQLSTLQNFAPIRNQLNDFNSKAIQNQFSILDSVKLFEKNKDDEYLSIMQKCTDKIAQQNRERNKREIENNESLKSLVSYNEELVNYNQELVNLNNKILNKINSLDDTLNFLNSAFEDKVDFDKGKMQEQTALLLELTTIMDSKDKDKIKGFMSNIASPTLVWALTKYFEMKFGLS